MECGVSNDEDIMEETDPTYEPREGSNAVNNIEPLTIKSKLVQ